MSKILALIAILALSGCVGKPIVETQVVEKFVPVPCEVRMTPPSGSDLNLTTTSIVSGQPVSISSFTITEATSEMATFKEWPYTRCSLPYTNWQTRS